VSSLLVVLDDIGRADTGVNEKSNIQMPNLQALAKSGVVLDNYYTQTVCSPTRSALMTGLFPFRFGMQHPTTVLPSMSAGVPLDVPMLPELLKKQGYESHMIGKWHCGYATWEHTPTGRGFESFLGYMQAQGDYFKHNVAIPELGWLDGLDFWENRRPMREAVGNYSLDLYRRAQRQVVHKYAARHDSAEKRASHPLFLYLAHQTVHIPLQPRQHEGRCDHLGHKGKRKDYCSMLVELDDALGELVDVYKQAGLWENTLVLLTTDNGGMVNWAPQNQTNDPIFPASAGRWVAAPPIGLGGQAAEN
jgi:arylsulfatase A-like enzyme